MSFGTFTHTSIDGHVTEVSYEMDKDKCLVRTMKVGDAVKSAQVNADHACAQLDNYMLPQNGKFLSGGDLAAIKAKILKAKPAKPAAELAAAASTTDWGNAEDY